MPNYLKKQLKNSKCCDIRSVHNDTSKDTNIQYDRHLSAKYALKEIRKDKIGNMVTNFTNKLNKGYGCPTLI